MIDIDELCRRFNLDGIVGLDWETFWSSDFTLKKFPTTEYVYDERFKAHMCSVQWHSETKAHVLSADELKYWARHVNWKRTGMLAHHTHFDGLIASRHFNIVPAMYFDTLSMARPIMPITTGNSLFALCRAFGRESKKRGNILQETKGVRDLSPQQYKKMALYAGDDIADCWFLFRKFLPYLSDEELRVIDATVRMYCVPRVLIDQKKVQALHDTEVREKAEALAALNKAFKRRDITAKTLRSASSFAALLRDAGCEPPKKLNKKEQVTLAFAKSDLAFKALLGHRNKTVQQLVRARLRLSSSILEKRALRMARRAVYGPQPVYLNYCGALTHRWSGSDKMNWQNFNRGSDLRSAIHAPPGYKLIVADSAQIEARLNACFCGQYDKVEQFRNGEDVYAHTATKVYGRTITKDNAPQERFVGKVCDLSLGYQSGIARFAHTLRVGSMGPAVDMTDDQVREVHAGWRRANYAIVANWKATMTKVKQAFVCKTVVEDGCVSYEGRGRHGYMHLPNGMSIRYAELEIDDQGGISYLNKVKGATQKRVRLYGGLLVENRTQALSRVLLASWIVRALDACPYMQLVMTTHDEVVFVVPNARAQTAHKTVRQIMTVPPSWMPDLPLGVDSHITDIYDKA